jgi:hypothetical protein
MKLPGFIGPTYTLRTPNYQCQRTINLFPELDETGGTAKEKEVMMLCSVPGQLKVGSVVKTPIRALHFTAFGKIICVAGNTVYYLNSSDQGDTWDNPTPIAQLTTSTGPVSIADGIPNMYNGVSNTGQVSVVVVVDDSNFGVVFEEGTTIPIQLNTGNEYNGAKYVTFQDGFFIFTQNTKSPACFFANDPYNISGLDVVVANLGPDYISRVISDHDVVWFFGGRSSSVWQNTGGGTGANIFQQIPGSYAEGGCSYPDTIQKCSGQLLWVTSDERGMGMVFQAAGYRGLRISNHAVELWIAANKDGLSGATAWTYQDQGHSFYVLNIPGSETTWAYDLVTKMWSERAFFKNGVLSRDLIENRVVLYGEFKPQILCSDQTTGNLYRLDNDTYTLNGEPIYRMRTAPHASSGLKRVFFSQAQIDVETGVGADGLGVPYLEGYDYNNPSGGTAVNREMGGEGPVYYFLDEFGNHVTPNYTPTPVITCSGTYSNSYTWNAGDDFITVNPTDFVVPTTFFGTGSGSQTNYTFTLGGLAAGTTVTSANIYEWDWRGNHIQSPTAITNLCKDSEEFFGNTTWTYDGVTVAPSAWTTYPSTTITAVRPTATSQVYSSGGLNLITHPEYVYSSSENTLRTNGLAATGYSDRDHSVYQKWTGWGSGVNKTGTLSISIDSNANAQGTVSIWYSIDGGTNWLGLWFTNTPSIVIPTMVGAGKQFSQATPLQTTLTIADMSQFAIEITVLGPQGGGTDAPSTCSIYDMCFLESTANTSFPSENAPDGVNTGSYLIEDKSYGFHGVSCAYDGEAGDVMTASVYFQKGDSKRDLELGIKAPILTFTGSLIGNQLTVSVPPLTGTLAVGQTITAPGIYPGTTIIAGTSSPYTLSWTATTANPVTAEVMEASVDIMKVICATDGTLTELIGYGLGGVESVSPTFIGSIVADQLTVDQVLIGTLQAGQIITGPEVPVGTTILTGSSSPYTLSYSFPTPLSTRTFSVNEGGVNSTGVYRVWASGMQTVTGTHYAGLLMWDENASTNNYYTGSGVARTGVWGMQIQKGSITQYIKSASGVSGSDYITISPTTGTVIFNVAPFASSYLTWNGTVHGVSISPVVFYGSFDYTSYPPIYSYLGTDPKISLSYSDDGGHTFSPEREISMGKLGNYTRRCIWRRLGQSRDRVFRVTCKEPVKFNLIGAEFKATEAEVNG